MTLEKVVSVDRMDITQNGIVQFGMVTRILEDGKEISRTTHRSTVSPGDDYSQLDPRIQAVCAVVHTQEAITEYQAKQFES